MRYFLPRDRRSALSLAVMALLVTGFALCWMRPAHSSDPPQTGNASAASVEPAPEISGSEVSAHLDAQREKTLSRRDALIASLTIFVLAIFVGFEIITKVPPTLHTPLMSGSNAISGITVVGALLAAGGTVSFSAKGVPSFVGMLALFLATINVVGGFMVTGRMLAMFQRK